jgi:hypothetical protein
MDRRLLRLEVRLGTAELEAWRLAAVAAGLSVSELVRGRVNPALPAGSLRWRPGTADGDPWREVFLEALRSGRSVVGACRAAGVSRTLVYRERARSREFAISWELAQERAEHQLSDRLLGTPLIPRYPLGPAATTIDAGTQMTVGAAPARRDRLQIRLKPEELEAWRAAAAELGVGVSELVRRLVNGSVRVPAVGERAVRSWRPLFVEALRRSGSVAAACRASGVSRTLAYSERDLSPEFASSWEAAAGEAEDRLIALLYRWGVTGIPVVSRKVTTKANGEVVTVVRESRRISAWALIELMRRVNPERWKLR